MLHFELLCIVLITSELASACKKTQPNDGSHSSSTHPFSSSMENVTDVFDSLHTLNKSERKKLRGVTYDFDARPNIPTSSKFSA